MMGIIEKIYKNAIATGIEKLTYTLVPRYVLTFLA